MSDLRVTPSRALGHVTDEKAAPPRPQRNVGYGCECRIGRETGRGKLIVQYSCLCKLKYVHSNAITF